MRNQEDDSRIIPTDPMVGYLQHSAKAYGTDAVEASMFNEAEAADEHLWALAQSYEDRDMCTFITRAVISDLLEYGFEYVPWGGHPGGPPYSECRIVTHPNAPRAENNFTGNWDDTVHYLTFGLGEDKVGDQYVSNWFVQLATDDGNPIKFVTLSWREATPDRIKAYLIYYMKSVQTY